MINVKNYPEMFVPKTTPYCRLLPIPSIFLFRILVFMCLFPAFPAQAGDWDAGATAGITIYLGNKTNRVGVFAGAWVRYDFMQVNPGIRVYYNFKNLGPPDRYWEFDSYGGLLLGWGRVDSMDNPFITSVSNHTMRRYSIAYSYNIYRDGMGTSQKTGTVALQFDKISVITENDLWGDNKDRFRTAAATVQYRHESAIFSITALLWTGEKGTTITGDGYPSRRGYKKPGRFGQYSHGILCLQAQQHLDYGQTVQAGAGIDAEQIRHAFQNKFIHDLAFFPAKWVKAPSAHIPMLDTEGEPYLYKSGQKIRNPTPYFNIATNPGLFY